MVQDAIEKERKQELQFALNSLQRLRLYNTEDMRGQILDTARSSNYLDIWIEVFKVDRLMSSMLKKL